MKKIICLLLALLIVLVFTACTGQGLPKSYRQQIADYITETRADDAINTFNEEWGVARRTSPTTTTTPLAKIDDCTISLGTVRYDKSNNTVYVDLIIKANGTVLNDISSAAVDDLGYYLAKYYLDGFKGFDDGTELNYEHHHDFTFYVDGEEYTGGTTSSSKSSSSKKTAKCNYCNGTGRVNGESCPWCGGSGKTYDNGFNDALAP